MKKRLWLILMLAGGLLFGSWLASGSFRRLIQVRAQAQQSKERSGNASQLDGFDLILFTLISKPDFEIDLSMGRGFRLARLVTNNHSMNFPIVGQNFVGQNFPSRASHN